MIRFDVDFTPHPLERAGIEETKEDLRTRLEGHDIQDLRIVLKKPVSGKIELQFRGEPAMVERAKRLLGVY